MNEKNLAFKNKTNRHLAKEIEMFKNINIDVVVFLLGMCTAVVGGAFLYAYRLDYQDMIYFKAALSLLGVLIFSVALSNPCESRFTVFTMSFIVFWLPIVICWFLFIVRPHTSMIGYIWLALLIPSISFVFVWLWVNETISREERRKIKCG